VLIESNKKDRGKTVADKKVVDIAGPGDAKVDIGSKPMIVGHKSLASDPMFREEPPAETEIPSGEKVAAVAGPETSVAKEPSKQKVIVPVADAQAENQKTAPAPTVVTEAPKDEASTVATKEKTAANKPEGIVLKEDPAKRENDEAVAAMEQEQSLQKLIESKKYRVSIKQARGSSKMLTYILLSGLVGMFIAVYLLVDSGKINLGFDVPFSILGEDKPATKTVATAEPVVEQKVLENTPKAAEEVSSKSWFVFDNPDYSMRVPDGWVLSTKEDSVSSLFSTKAIYEAGKAGVVEKYSEEKIQPEMNVFVVDVAPELDAEYCLKNFVEGDVTTLKTENGLTIYKRIAKGTASETTTSYCIQAEEKTYQASYTNYKGESDQSSYAEKAVMTLKPR
jgi:hypothetical protein